MRRYSNRPFPSYRHEPGKTPHPERDPSGHSYGLENAPLSDDFDYAVDLFNAGYGWEAHVYFERLWQESTDPAERLFLQALIQLSAASVKKREGNRVGERKLVAKALEKLRSTPLRASDRLFGVSVAELCDCVSRGDVVVVIYSK